MPPANPSTETPPPTLTHPANQSLRQTPSSHSVSSIIRAGERPIASDEETDSTIPQAGAHLPALLPRNSSMSQQDLQSTSLSDRHFRSNFSYHNPQARANRHEHVTANGSYSNRTPSRQSLYDWATAASGSSPFWSNHPGNTLPPRVEPDSLDQHDTEESTLVATAQRRLLERESRRQLEPRDEPSGRIRVPAPRHRSPSEEEREEQIARLSAHGRSPSVTAALSRLIERQRIERRERRWEREHAVESGNGRSDDYTLRAARARALRELRSRERFAQYLDSRRRMRPPTMPKTVNILRYLSHLRDCGDYVEAHTLAAAMNLSTLFSPSSTTIPSDLTMSIDVLPKPQYSSFLTPGTSFQGIQRTPQEPPMVFLNRDRDYLRRMVANRNLNFSSANLPGSLTALMDAERLVLDMLDENPQPNEAGTSSALPAGNLSQPNDVPPQSDGRRTGPSHLPDSWPVRATIHTLSLDTMTLTGTMCASHIPDKLSPTSPEHHPDGSSMESYFEGELIDFNNFTLETSNERFKAGGIEVDARHWRGVGPFRQIAQTVRRHKLEAKGTTPNIDVNTATRAQLKTLTMVAADSLTYEEEEELEAEIDEAVARCLGSTEWLAETMLEWVLMRWKERCFVNLPPGTAASDRFGNALTGRFASSATTVTSTAAPLGGYGLTISGFYYIALKRSSGFIDGLYFDPGSQPYQELTLVPEGTDPMSRHLADQEPLADEEKASKDNGEMECNDEGQAPPDKDDDGCNKDRDYAPCLSAMRQGGLKKWFPSIEVR